MEVDFTPPFRRISMVKDLEKKLNMKFPEPSTFTTKEANKFFDDLCTKLGVECSAPRTTTRLLDKVGGQIVLG